jgi:hypothetical protein
MKSEVLKSESWILLKHRRGTGVPFAINFTASEENDNPYKRFLGFHHNFTLKVYEENVKF